MTNNFAVLEVYRRGKVCKANRKDEQDCKKSNN